MQNRHPGEKTVILLRFSRRVGFPPRVFFFCCSWRKFLSSWSIILIIRMIGPLNQDDHPIILVLVPCLLEKVREYHKKPSENSIFTLPGEVREKSWKSQVNYRIRAAPRQFLMLDSVPNGRQQAPKGRALRARPFGICCLPFGTESSIKNCRGTARMR